MKIRSVDLGTGKWEEQELDHARLRHFLGGSGLGARILADFDNPSLPPLHVDLPLILSGGPLAATGFPGATRLCFVGVSPLTSITAGSWLGGNFSTKFARSGTHTLVLKGRAREPSIVVLTQDRIEVVPRPDLWGLETSPARAALLKDYPNAGIATIGPAGEKLIPFATVRGDEGHMSGRCGMGAILGSKNIKAIVTDGSAKPSIADPEGLKAVIKEAFTAIKESHFLQDVQGPISTTCLVAPINDFQALPVANHRERFFKTADKITGETIKEKWVVRRTTCPSCPVRCRLHSRVDGKEYEAPEYESLWALGPENNVDDYPLIVRATDLCNELGVDTISTGVIVAMYREHAGTLDDPSDMLDLIGKIVAQEGVVKILSRGSREAAGQLGIDYAMHVKGLELAAYDPRKMTGMALSYSTTNRGGCHTRAWTINDELSGKEFTGEELAEIVARLFDLTCVRDSLIMCTFVDTAVKPLYDRALSCVTGIPFTNDELRVTGERIYTLERMLNVRRGVRASADVLPARLRDNMVEPEKYAAGMRHYYTIRGWDADGRPGAEKLKSLGLEFMIR